MQELAEYNKLEGLLIALSLKPIQTERARKALNAMVPWHMRWSREVWRVFKGAATEVNDEHDPALRNLVAPPEGSRRLGSV